MSVYLPVADVRGQTPKRVWKQSESRVIPSNPSQRIGGQRRGVCLWLHTHTEDKLAAGWSEGFEALTAVDDAGGYDGLGKDQSDIAASGITRLCLGATCRRGCSLVSLGFPSRFLTFVETGCRSTAIIRHNLTQTT